MSWVEEQSWWGLEDLVEVFRFPKELLYEEGIWVTKDGKEIPVRDMTDTHLDNAIRMIEDGRLNRRWALPYLKSEKKRRERQSFIDNFFDDLIKDGIFNNG